jgi:hypothetical protein
MRNIRLKTVQTIASVSYPLLLAKGILANSNSLLHLQNASNSRKKETQKPVISDAQYGFALMPE